MSILLFLRAVALRSMLVKLVDVSCALLVEMGPADPAQYSFGAACEEQEQRASPWTTANGAASGAECAGL